MRELLRPGKLSRPSGCHGLPLSYFFLASSGARVLARNSFISSSYMNLVTLYRNFSEFTTGFLHRLSDKGPGLRAVTMWCMATSRLKLRLLSPNLSNISMKDRKDSIFSYRMFTKVMDMRWCRRLVANCVPNFATSVLKQSIECADKQVN